MEKEEQPLKIMKINEIKAMWDNFAPLYSLTDTSMQTFYYTLINMLNISKANNILQIACGTGKLLPQALNMKPLQCKYLASDLSDTMIQFTKLTLTHYLEKVGVQQTIENWMQRNNLTVKALNGEEKIETEQLFDRIICNLVIMTTENPVKMLNNLHSVAAQGCLMGVTIWGDKKLSNLLNLNMQALEDWGIPAPNIRSNFHLYNKLEQLAAETGWQIVVQWQQLVPFNFLEINQDLIKLVNSWSRNDQKLIDYQFNKIKQTFDHKGTLNFPAQLAILRKI